MTYVSHCNHQNVSLPVRFQADYCLECLYVLIFCHSLKHGYILLAVSRRNFVMDITVCIDVELNPGQRTMNYI